MKAAERYADPELGEAKRAQMRAYHAENSERLCAEARDRYWNLDTIAYHRRLLQVRRQNALTRLEARNGKV